MNNNKELIEKLVLLDGNGIMHRAFHAYPPLSTSQGELVNAVYGFTIMLLQVIKTINPNYIICAFDHPAPTLRVQQYSDYKVHRVKMDEGLAGQFKLVKEVLKAFNIPFIEKAGYEADDIIGTLALKAANIKNLKTVVVTGDRDLLQLLGKNIEVILPGKTFSDNQEYNEERFEEKYGFSHKYFTDMRALTGDNSDNIPGVKGIGEKGAATLIKQFNTLENIYNNLDKISKSYREKLEKDRDNAFLSKKLSTIITDMPIDLILNKVEEVDKEEIKKLFLRFEFRSLLNKIPSNDEGRIGDDVVSEKAVFRVITVEDQKTFNLLLKEITQVKHISLDVWYTGDTIVDYTLRSLAIATNNSTVYSISLSPEKNIKKELSLEWKEFKNLLEDENIKKIGYHLKNIIHVLFNEEIYLRGLYFDNLLAGYLLDPGKRDLTLNTLFVEQCAVEISNILEFKSKSKDSASDLEVLENTTSKAIANYLLFETIDSKLTDRVRHVFDDIEIPLICVLADMERHGVLISQEDLHEQKKFLEEKIHYLEKVIYEIAGYEFNINSFRQLGNFLFSELNLPSGRKIKTGYSTDDKVLNSLEGLHPVINKIKEYRELSKLYSTYIIGLEKLLDKNNRLHTTFNQHIASTGRLSSTNPNLQNIPIRTEVGKKIREIFIAPEGHTLLSIDYSQIELRLLAHFSHDPVLVEAFREGKDIHTTTASQIFNIKENEVTSNQRRMAKIINFGIVYGMSEYGLFKQLGITKNEAKKFIDTYFEKYKGVKDYMNNFIDHVEQVKYTESFAGRKRYIPQIDSANRMLKEQAKREAINMPLQGTNADIIKMAMLEIYKQGREFKVYPQMIIQVHDELLFELDTIDPVLIKETAKKLADIMSHVVVLDVDILVEAKCGKNWGSMETINDLGK